MRDNILATADQIKNFSQTNRNNLLVLEEKRLDMKEHNFSYLEQINNSSQTNEIIL
jgi:hypothetical protein